jgi:hypothetical protein
MKCFEEHMKNHVVDYWNGSSGFWGSYCKYSEDKP